jgi:adenine-specific DNA glycosylase
LGRAICQARKPNCPICPLKQICEYYRVTYLEVGVSVPSDPENRARQPR